MPFYHRLGKLPEKRHTQFRKPDGSLYAEELISTEGFSSLYSLVYHCHPPTLVKEIEHAHSVAPEAALPKNLRNRSFLTFHTAPKDDYLESRVVMLFNRDLYLTVAAPRKSMTDYFYKNADADEVIFIHEGSGNLKTLYGNIPFEYGD
jgi:homogentisate 1,2-dioxygenase